MSTDTIRRPGSGTFLGVQAARGLAAAMVVAYHATQMWAQHAGDGKSASVWGNGANGVDVFFVISGFVMAVSTIGREHKRHPARNFLEKRVIRVVPLYWIMTAVMLAKAVAIAHYPALQNSTEHLRLNAGYLIASLLFIPYRNSLGVIQPVLFVGWTLYFEAFFYMLFAVALALRVGVLRWLTPVMVLLIVAGAVFHPGLAPLTVITSPLLLEFLTGVALGHATLRGHRLPFGLSMVLGAIGVGALLAGPRGGDIYAQTLMCGVPALLLIQAMVAAEAKVGDRWPRWTLGLGDASYSLYLVHPVIFTFLFKLLNAAHVLSRPVIRLRDELVTVAVALVVCIPIAWGMYKLVESPITVALRERWLGEGKPREQVV